MLSLYAAQKTWLHRVAAGPKLASLCVLGTGLLLVGDLRWLLGGCAMVLALFVSLGRPAWRALPRLRAVVVMAVLIAAFHAWVGSPALGVVSALRLVTGILLATMLTLTTRFDDLLDVLESLLRPLQALGIPTGRLALALALVLRFIDVFHGQWQRLDDAHRARTGRGGGLRLLAPLTLRTLQTADRVADALAARLGR
ncbi:energy-coupling factor transporter transmembrane component T family protein [Pseudorhodoferax soli]|uniref:Biotin transport system permease protein n=1 Tax=Pseudorhodoferax soli TaxID=545864 RepID=A0A368XRG3_9BURK|nr:energy-coupling factor transporter transmembrane protein EcfT [Pseudorhodoferax soli]RCW68594.1 biotin transport system permease protein [Pseudorhodoferax soli]